MHKGGFNFYQKAIANKSKPWSYLAFSSIPYMIWQAIRNKQKPALLLICWIAATYILYSLVQTKLHWYIMPIYPALGISCALLIERLSGIRFYKIVLIVIITGMLLQIPYSWAFRLDLNPDAKHASEYSKAMLREGKDIYIYRIDDNADKFYMEEIGLLDKGILQKALSGKSDVYCLIKRIYIPEAENRCGCKLDIINDFGDFVITEVKRG
jgi:hypothetical protein